MIYLISGKRFSGKDYYGNILQKNLKGVIIKTSFAEQAKKEYCKQNNLIYKNFNTREIKEKHRKNLIYFCQNKKKINKYCWCIKLFENIKTINYDHLIITDLRYPEEIEYFKINNIKFKTIRINSSLDTRIKRGLKLSNVDNHISETYLDNFNFDTIIKN